MQRKQFGRRGLVPNTGQSWAPPQPAAVTANAYQSAPEGPAAFEDNDSFSFGKALTHGLSIFFSFKGRLGRMEYWTIGFIRFFIDMVLISTLVWSAYPAFMDLMSRADQMSESARDWSVIVALYGSNTGMICGSLLLVTAVSYWSILVRRNHDRDVSGFWLLLLLVPVVNIFYGLYIFVVNGFIPGTPGNNRFDTHNSQPRVFD